MGRSYRVKKGAKYENNHVECLPISPLQCGIRINGLTEAEKAKWR